jgi:hypothetical protein
MIFCIRNHLFYVLNNGQLIWNRMKMVKLIMNICTWAINAITIITSDNKFMYKIDESAPLKIEHTRISKVDIKYMHGSKLANNDNP